MIDLGKELKRWRASLLSSLVLREEDVDELEYHLRDSMEALLAEGLSEEAAFDESCQRLGDAESITKEFAKENVAMNALSRIIGFVIAVSTVVLSAATCGLVAFIHFPSLIFILGVMIGGLLLSFCPSVVLKAIARGFGIGKASSPEELKLDIMVFERARHLAWAGGFLASLTGFIAMMSADAASNHGYAIIVLNLFYAVLLAEVIITPLKHAMIARFPGIRHNTDVQADPA